jgi:hypothetical protein
MSCVIRSEILKMEKYLSSEHYIVVLGVRVFNNNSGWRREEDLISGRNNMFKLTTCKEKYWWYVQIGQLGEYN